MGRWDGRDGQGGHRAPGAALRVLALPLGAWAMLALSSCQPAAEVPVWATLPEFTLSNQQAEPFGTAQLAGKPFVADFIFTKCPGRCPMLTREMAGLQRELVRRSWDDVQLVSVSVDPENDTPEALAAYAEKHGANQGRWHFLTGARDAIWALSAEGFKLAVAEGSDVAGGPILHSNQFVLADASGRIRGYYDAFDEAERADLVRDLAHVRAEGVTIE